MTAIREATEADLEAIRAIYNESIPKRIATADLEPQSAEARRAWFVQRDHAKRPVLVAVDAQLDLKAMASALGVRRVDMADPQDAERLTGYVVGGISPLGQRRRLPTVIDERVMLLPRVHVSAGRRGLEIALAPADLVAATGATLATLARASG